MSMNKFKLARIPTTQKTGSSTIPESYICVGTGYNLLGSPYISPEYVITAKNKALRAN